jgi:hypothetical protein
VDRSSKVQDASSRESDFDHDKLLCDDSRELLRRSCDQEKGMRSSLFLAFFPCCAYCLQGLNEFRFVVPDADIIAVLDRINQLLQIGRIPEKYQV